MNVFAIGDLHLAGGTGKTMDRFGDNWRDHDRRIFEAWERTVGEDDLVLVVGDTSWAVRLEHALPDLERIGRMPGVKLLVKGNHDYWWETRTKMNRALHPSIKILNASSIIVNRIAVAGTRGWVCPNDLHFTEKDQTIYERELGRLRTALEALRGRESEFDLLIVALHYPPAAAGDRTSRFIELIDEYGADACVYGHLHGDDIKTALTGRLGKTTFYLVSADAANFAPADLGIQSLHLDTEKLEPA
jgi:predicted phosphohydrolase